MVCDFYPTWYFICWCVLISTAVCCCWVSLRLCDTKNAEVAETRVLSDHLLYILCFGSAYQPPKTQALVWLGYILPKFAADKKLSLFVHSQHIHMFSDFLLPFHLLVAQPKFFEASTWLHFSLWKWEKITIVLVLIFRWLSQLQLSVLWSPDWSPFCLVVKTVFLSVILRYVYQAFCAKTPSESMFLLFHSTSTISGLCVRKLNSDHFTLCPYPCDNLPINVITSENFLAMSVFKCCIFFFITKRLPLHPTVPGEVSGDLLRPSK